MNNGEAATAPLDAVHDAVLDNTGIDLDNIDLANIDPAAIHDAVLDNTGIDLDNIDLANIDPAAIHDAVADNTGIDLDNIDLDAVHDAVLDNTGIDLDNIDLDNTATPMNNDEHPPSTSYWEAMEFITQAKAFAPVNCSEDGSGACDMSLSMNAHWDNDSIEVHWNECNSSIFYADGSENFDDN